MKVQSERKKGFENQNWTIIEILAMLFLLSLEKRHFFWRYGYAAVFVQKGNWDDCPKWYIFEKSGN